MSDKETNTDFDNDEQVEEIETSDDDEEIFGESEAIISSMNLIQGTEKFVITVDNTPYCYTDNIDYARKLMWDLARLHKFININCNTYIRENTSQDEIQLVGYYKLFTFGYDRVMCDIKIKSVKQAGEVKQPKSYIVNQSKTGGFIKTIFG